MRHPTLSLCALSLCALAALAGCSTSERFYTVPEAPAEALAPQRIRYGTVLLTEVSLPDYAGRQQIAARGEDGAVAAQRGVLWADLPQRGMTQELARDLSRITGAQVAAEPWPFNSRAQVRVEVRVEQMLDEGDGSFRLSGQYFVAPEESDGGRSGLFDLRAPITGEGPAAIAAARSAVVAQLAQRLAGDGLR